MRRVTICCKRMRWQQYPPINVVVTDWQVQMPNTVELREPVQNQQHKQIQQN
jgi:hypothetical protein